MGIHLAELRRYKLFSREDIHIDSLIVPLQTSRSRRTSIKMVNINLHLHFLIPPTRLSLPSTKLERDLLGDF